MPIALKYGSPTRWVGRRETSISLMLMTVLVVAACAEQVKPVDLVKP
jgi:hypothetical protein